eukprot:ANDGO_00253.mRNA.1 Protein HIRA
MANSSFPFSVRRVRSISHGQSIFSADFHPDGSRFVTCGLDKKVRIWDAAPFEEPEDSDKTSSKGLLAEISQQHNPNTARFSPDGRWLAVAWDDGAVRLYAFSMKNTDSHSLPERWDCKMQLTGHKDDCVDIAWSPDSRSIVSCGVDRSVRLWKIEGTPDVVSDVVFQHENHAKGVIWDPVGEFVVSCGADFRLVAIRLSDRSARLLLPRTWLSARKTICNSFFSRLSWSPTGEMLVIPHVHSPEDKSPVVCVVQRTEIVRLFGLKCTVAEQEKGDDWHFGDDGIVTLPCESTVVCSRFNQTLFRRSVSDSFASYFWFAVGSMDRSVQIFNLLQREPWCSLANVFKEDVRDIVWSPLGNSLLLVARTVVLVTFRDDALGQRCDAADLRLTFRRIYGDGFLGFETGTKVPLDAFEVSAVTPVALLSSVGKTDAPQPPAGSTIQTVEILKSGKKRINPILVTSMASPVSTPPPVHEGSKKVETLSGLLSSRFVVQGMASGNDVHNSLVMDASAPPSKRAKVDSSLITCRSYVVKDDALVVDGAFDYTVRGYFRDDITGTVLSLYAQSEIWKCVIFERLTRVFCVSFPSCSFVCAVSDTCFYCWDLLSGVLVSPPVFIGNIGDLRFSLINKAPCVGLSSMKPGGPVVQFICLDDTRHCQFYPCVFCKTVEEISEFWSVDGDRVVVITNGGLVYSASQGKSSIYYLGHHHRLCELPPLFHRISVVSKLASKITKPSRLPLSDQSTLQVVWGFLPGLFLLEKNVPLIKSILSDLFMYFAERESAEIFSKSFLKLLDILVQDPCPVQSLELPVEERKSLLSALLSNSRASLGKLGDHLEHAVFQLEASDMDPSKI